MRAPRCFPKTVALLQKGRRGLLFDRKEDNVLLLFDRLIETVGQWPEVQFSATKACIVFVSTGTFLVAKPMKKALDLHFSLPEPDEDSVVYKCVQYGSRFVHYIRLKEPQDLNARVLALIRRAYKGEG
jgi:hypothetical protein